MNAIIPDGMQDFELREWLKQKIVELDETKRKIRDQIRQFSSERVARKSREDFAWLRKAKAKVSFLIAEREELRGVLGDVNQRLKDTRKMINNASRPNMKLAQAFMMLAEEKLNDDIFRRLENEALTLLERDGKFIQ